MKLTLIAEGSTKWQRLIRRWGISFLIGDDILFDTFGDVKVFLSNLARTKIDASKICHVVISHDHWDHLAGLWPFLEKHKNVTVYICPGFSQETKDRIASLGVRVVEAFGLMEIKKGIYTTGQIKGACGGEDIYEQAVVVKIERGLAVITGCAHPGITKIIDKVIKDFGQPVSWVIGGFHLKDVDRKEIESIALRLKEIGVQKVVPLHCTGKSAQGILKKLFKEDAIVLSEGKILSLDK
jgi:7,8-dihydropterin-6-yl-methyl-4-(beta-D-ribofuranosyl)aminobenzene 5'-phosphate synthase